MIIYKAQNKINNKIYIGQTVKDVNERIMTHFKINKYYFQRALNKYGIKSFIISVIDHAKTHDDLNGKEKYWIAFYDCKAPCGYNCTDGGDGVKGYKHTEEDRERNRLSHLGKKASKETRLKMSTAHKGKNISKEQRKKISIARKGVKFSEEHKQKLSTSKRGIKHPNYGKSLPEETRRKIGLGNSGKIRSDETRQKLRESNLGKRHSKETRQKMNESQKALWITRKQGKIL